MDDWSALHEERARTLASIELADHQFNAAMRIVRKAEADYAERLRFYHETEEITGCERRFVRPVNAPVLFPAAQPSPDLGGTTAGALKDE